ncbi:hypothetical protein FNF29_00563 [Cafeteria roenbergensis]|uniref:Anaphase-promoting complex subunit 4-like WD40 domain-containing protein n=1 Tax=Cafeteria roenbergensis TaxID=33653 RepID=A0A5A8CZI8_CAFRO|nr:hypothetical protein FNF29_00563 [Cafeteria roenbergensis]|eukprot:KAA0157211.1 hypothetical protein FNF29_00563 [Cafeteria roenbergensis]
MSGKADDSAARRAVDSMAAQWPIQEGSVMRQFQLVPSGCQGWFSRVVGGGGGHFAYASTLAVYVYRVADYSLSSVLTGHQRTITGLSWSVANPRFFATSGADLKLVMWDAHLGQQVLSRTLTSNAFVVEFSPLAPHLVAFACEDKWVGVWDTRENSVTRVCQSGKSSARCVRWNERREGLLAIGCKNGQILLHNMSTRKTRELVAGGTEASPVADLRWDRLSEDYLLAAFRDGTLALYDVERGTQVQRFEKQGASVTALEWLPWQPGSFASINGRAGVVRIWNVSQRAPLEVVQVSDRPAWGMSLLPGTTRLLLSFLDGAVAVFDLATRSLRHRGLPGHIETIFDAQFHPTDPDTLATASYDASVKVWHAPSMRCAQTLTGNTGPLYSLCWSPDGSRIAASSGKGRVVVWDVCTGAVIMLKDDAHASTSLRVSWSRTDPDLLASVGMDKVVVLWSVSDKVAKQRVNHPNDVMGCDWCPVTPGRLATACADGKVRVYFLAPVGPRLDFEFDAHVGRAFNVAFSPLVPQLLASGGDDGRVVVHHLGKGTSTKLIGHTDKVRALCWHPELPRVLLSGAWDGRICAFDVVAGTCIVRHSAHQADVYGLSIHPLRPFTAVSSSRDTSLRFWDIRGPSAGGRRLALRALCDPCALQGMRSDDPAASMESSRDALCGAGSAAAVAAIAEATGGAAAGAVPWSEPAGSASQVLLRAKAYAAVGALFFDADGASDLWRLVRPGAAAPPAVGDGMRAGGGVPPVLWCADAAAATRQRAVKADSARLGEWVGGVGGPSEAEIRASAARLFLRCGDVRRYCDVLAAAGRWDEALAAAPASGLAYWRELAAKRAAALSEDGTDKALPLFVATGDIDGASALLASRGEAAAAVTMQHAAASGAWDKVLQTAALASSVGVQARGEAKASDGQSSLSAAQPSVSDVVALGRRRATARRNASAAALAKEHAAKGAAARAACHSLSVGDAASAVRFLVRGGLPAAAFAVARALDVRPRTSAALGVASLMQREGMGAEALVLLRQEGIPTVEVAMLAAQYKQTAQSHAAREELADAADRAGLGSAEHWRSNAAALTGAGREAEAVAALVAAGEWEQAATRGSALMRVELCRRDWSAQRIRSLAATLGHIPATSLPKRRRARLLALCAVAGAMHAVDRGSVEVASGLVLMLRRLVAACGLKGLGVSILRVACVLARAYLGANMPDAAAALLTAASAAPGAEPSTAGNPPAGASAQEASAEDDEDEAEEERAEAALLESLSARGIAPPPTAADDSATAANLAERAAAASASAKPRAASGGAPLTRTFVVDGSSLPRTAQRPDDLPIAKGRPAPTGSVSGRAARGPRVLLGPSGQWCTVAEALEWAQCSAFSPLADGSLLPLALS